MQVQVFKTDKVTARSHDLFKLLDDSLPPLAEDSVVAVTAKIVSLCEGRVVSPDARSKDELVVQESQWYLPPSKSKYNLYFSITHNMLIPNAGIDESNANGEYILWPEDLQASANAIRRHLMEKHDLHNLGVIITDSTTRPFQWGTTGIAIAYSGFNPLKNYIGTEDIFGRKLVFQQSNLANGLAAATVLMMGEGSEQTPLAVVSDLPFIEFQDHDPTPEELARLLIEPDDDIYEPLLTAVDWHKGGRNS